MRWENGWSLTPSRDEIAFYHRNQQKSGEETEFVDWPGLGLMTSGFSILYLHLGYESPESCRAT